MHWSLLCGKKIAVLGEESIEEHQLGDPADDTGQTSVSIPVIPITSAITDSSVNGCHLFSKCTTAKQAGSCVWLAQISLFAAGTGCTSLHTMIMASHAKFCRCDMSHDVQQVELRATCCRGKFCTNSMSHEWKSVSTHESMCRCNMSLKSVPATFSQVCKLCDLVPPTCPCYTSLQQDPSACT